MTADPPHTSDIPLAPPSPFATDHTIAQAELALLIGTTGPNQVLPLQTGYPNPAQNPHLLQGQELNQDILAHLDKAVADLDRDRWQYDLKPDMVLF
ncbi:hypothetical protein H4R35_005015 [Dimargaris xerosporica]|nr:hypothetical protein H4R35_005015 [Dimargaris xerosporica]